MAELPEPASAVVRAHFQQIHPGDMSAYTHARQRDAWLDWYPDYWVGGNQRMVDAYLEHLASDLAFEAKVTRVVPWPSVVEVEHERAGVSHQAPARAVVATPATQARTLVTPVDPEHAAFLHQVRYRRYTVVAFVVDVPLRRFRVAVTPDAAFALVMQQRGPEPGFAALDCHYDDARSDFADGLDDVELAEVAARELGVLGLGDARVPVTPWWVQRWPVSGTIHDDAHAARSRPGFARASHRVFLAGDYLAQTQGWLRDRRRGRVGTRYGCPRPRVPRGQR